MNNPFKLPLMGDERIIFEQQQVRITEEHLQQGNINKQYTRVYFQPIVIILAMPDPEHIWMIYEQRAGERRTVWKFPAGKIEQGELAAEAAVRELEEEASLKADNVELLMELPYKHKTNNQHRHYFIATDLTESSIPPAEGEVILDKKLVNIKDLYQEVLDGKWDWSLSAFAILKLYRELS